MRRGAERDGEGVTRKTQALAALALLAGGYIAGRWTAPARREQVIVDREGSATTQARGVAYVQTSAVTTATRVVTRWRQTPAGPEVERIEEHGSQASTSSAGQAHETAARVEYRDLVQTRVETRAERTTWTVAAMGGLGLDGRRVLGGVVQRRILGPLTLGAWATSERVGGVTVGLQW